MQLLSNYGATKSHLCAIYHVKQNVKGMLTTDLILFMNRKTAILKTHQKIPKEPMVNQPFQVGRKIYIMTEQQNKALNYKIKLERDRDRRKKYVKRE